MYERLVDSPPGVIEYKIKGKLTKDELTSIHSELEKAIEEHGRIRVLVSIKGLSALQLPALWEDMKFTVKYADNIEKAAVVGDKMWERWVTGFSDSLVDTETRYFHELQPAREWLHRPAVAA